MMKRASLALTAAMISAGLLWAAYQGSLPQPTPLSPWFPAGPMLYLEAKDFSSLLADWNSSVEKRIWVDGSNYQVFSRSRLFLRLKGAGDKFSGCRPSTRHGCSVGGGRRAQRHGVIRYRQFAVSVRYLSSVGEIHADDALAIAREI